MYKSGSLSSFEYLFFLALRSQCRPLWPLKRHNSFQNKSHRKATHSFAPRSLIFKLQQEVLKFNDICVSWSSPETDLVASFLNLENRSFKCVSFSQ